MAALRAGPDHRRGLADAPDAARAGGPGRGGGGALTGGVPAPFATPPPRPPTPLQWALDVPGRLVHALLPAPRPVPGHAVPAEELARRAAASPRGNGYLALEPGLALHAPGDGLLAWASSGPVAFAVGGLHGTDPAGLLRGFRDTLAAAGYRRVLLFPVAPAEAPAVRAAGFEALAVGSEAFLDPRAFTLRGNAHADLRQMVNRGRKRYGLEVAERPADGSAAAELGPLWARWLASRPAGHRMRLLVGTPCFARPAGRRFFAVRHPDGAPAAFVTLTPGWGGEGWGVDVMARAPDAPAGAMEVLLTGVLAVLADEGARVLSLGACPMAEMAPVPAPDRPVLRAVFRWLYRSRLGNRLFPFRGLVHFKQKLVPRWEPVLIAGWPRMDVRALYAGCRMWGLFGPPRLDPPAPASLPAPAPGAR